MTNEPTDAVFDVLRAAAAEAQAKHDKWLLIDCAYDNLDELGDMEFDKALAGILALVESYPDLDYGGPGPFGTLIEEHPAADYTPQLLTSLQRQPSGWVVSLLDRMTRVPADQRGKNGFVTIADFIRSLEAVLQHPSASEDCRSFASLCLEDLRKL